jgi:hypothetical protein
VTNPGRRIAPHRTVRAVFPHTALQTSIGSQFQISFWTGTLSPLAPVPRFAQPLVSPVLYLRETLICCSLRSTGFHRFHRYYEAIRLLADLRRALRLLNVCHPPTALANSFALVDGACQTSQVCVSYLCMLATLSDPGGTCQVSRLRLAITACGGMEHLGFHLLYLRGSITSRFRIAALMLPCLRLNLTSRLRLQGLVPAARYALPGRVFHPTILHAPNWRTHAFYFITRGKIHCNFYCTRSYCKCRKPERQEKNW